jgi:hypothetical protein
LTVYLSRASELLIQWINANYPRFAPKRVYPDLQVDLVTSFSLHSRELFSSRVHVEQNETVLDFYCERALKMMNECMLEGVAEAAEHFSCRWTVTVICYSNLYIFVAARIEI